MSVIDLFKTKIAKSSVLTMQNQYLYDYPEIMDGKITMLTHSKGVFDICNMMIDYYNFDLEYKHKSILLISSFLHDIGKLNEDFQNMLSSQRIQKNRHEAYTLDYLNDIIIQEISKSLNLNIYLNNNDLLDIYTFIITHHGRLYIYGKSENINLDNISISNDTRLYNDEEKWRITLTDLLFKYHPVGGYVIFSDIIHSIMLEKKINIEQITKIIKKSVSIKSFLINFYDQNQVFFNENQNYSYNFIKLLLGGL